MTKFWSRFSPALSCIYCKGTSSSGDFYSVRHAFRQTTGNKTMHDHTFVLKAGWRTTYTDKHGRTTVTGTGPDRVGSHKGRNTLHPTLFRSRIRNKQLTKDNVHTALADKPGATVDVHLLRLITKHIPTQLLLSEVAGHPACARADKLADIMYIEPPEAQHRYCIWDAHTIHVTDHPTYADAISRHLQYNTAPLLIISQDTTIQECSNKSQ